MKPLKDIVNLRGIKLAGHILRLEDIPKQLCFGKQPKVSKKEVVPRTLGEEPSKKTLAVQAKPSLVFQLIQMTDNAGGPFLPDVFLNSGGPNSKKVS